MKNRFVLSPEVKGLYNDEQKSWLTEAYRTVVKHLKKNDTFHVNDFWSSFKGGDFPRTHSYDPDNRVLGQVFRQVIDDGYMVNGDTNVGYRVYKNGKPTSTFKPRFKSLIKS